MAVIIENKTFDEERALYHLQNACLSNCRFAGPADGESALKESNDISLTDCSFSLRYPLWHTKNFYVTDTVMDENTRAPIWYAQYGQLTNCRIKGIKCLRECSDIRVENCRIQSPEFGWKCRKLSFLDSSVESEYFLLDSKDISVEKLELKGKYSFQYVEKLHIRNSHLDTKDAFWHSDHVTVENSLLRGEYLGWFSRNLTLVHCHIIGTQPFCYCENLKLIGCTMEGTDLSFEYSDVHAEVNGSIDSVKNPKSGTISADSIGEIILEDSIMESTCQIYARCRS